MSEARPKYPVLLGRLRRSLAKCWDLTPRERRLLIGALLLLPIAVVRLRLTGPGAWQHEPAAAGLMAEEPAVIRDAARMVKAAARLVPFNATCLPQSIVLQQLLRQEGVETSIRLGVRKSDGALDGHAWVEYRGQPVSDPTAVSERFQVLSR